MRESGDTDVLFARFSFCILIFGFCVCEYGCECVVLCCVLCYACVCAESMKGHWTVDGRGKKEKGQTTRLVSRPKRHSFFVHTLVSFSCLYVFKAGMTNTQRNRERSKTRQDSLIHLPPSLVSVLALNHTWYTTPSPQPAPLHRTDP